MPTITVRTYPTREGMSPEYWSFDDPETFEGSEEERLEKFREVRDQMRSKLEKWHRAVTGGSFPERSDKANENVRTRSLSILY